jgi:hypothetical protein
MAGHEAQRLADLILEFAREKQRFEELSVVDLATFTLDERLRYLETYREVERSVRLAWERLNRAQASAAEASLGSADTAA